MWSPLTFDTSGSTLRQWSDFPLSVGDELTDDRPFIGELSELYLGSNWFSDDQVARYFAGQD